MKRGDDSMNQSKIRTGGERAFISKLEFSAIWLSVLVTVGLQGCDNSGNVSVERSANLDATVTEVVVAPSELKQQTPLLPVKAEHGPLRFKRIESFSELISSSWIEQKES